ncbi:MAG: putative lipid II flippase FtsW [Ktedonobacterales bacterium]
MRVEVMTVLLARQGEANSMLVRQRVAQRERHGRVPVERRATTVTRATQPADDYAGLPSLPMATSATSATSATIGASTTTARTYRPAPRQRGADKPATARPGSMQGDTSALATRALESPFAARFAQQFAQMQLQRLRQMDYPLLLAVVGLLTLGLLMVYSASEFASPGDPGYWFQRQALWATLGLIALCITARVDYHQWRRFALPGVGICLALLLAVLFFGRTAYGAQRWLYIGVSIQPSELAKLALALYLAHWLTRKGDDVRSWLYGLLPFAALTGLSLALVLAQNDMGTSLVIAVMAFTVFYMAGARLAHLLAMLALGGGVYAIVAFGTSFRRARLDAFLHPLPPGCSAANSYQVCQGLISLGSGGLFGRGLGESVQKAGYLPNPFTDSIFAIVGEELGLVGCVALLALFATLAWRGYRAGRMAPDAFGASLACGITTWLVAQALINIGSVVDAIPFTGVPLPFVSFGGSSLITTLAAVGVLFNISRQRESKQ